MRRLCSQLSEYKDVVRHSNVGMKKFSYVLLALSPCVLSQKYLHGLGLDFGLEDLASDLAWAFWPRLTSLYICNLCNLVQ